MKNKAQSYNYTKRELARLRKSLPKGFVQDIAKLTDSSIATASRVLNGTQPDNNGIIDCALEIAEKNKTAIIEKKTRILAL